MQVELDCGDPDCDGEITDWVFGDDVTCPTCGKVWATDYETNYDDDIQGPWITGAAEGKE